MVLEHGRSDGFSMDALVTECSWGTDGIMAGNGTQLQLGRCYGLGIVALVTERLRSKQRQWNLIKSSLVLQVGNSRSNVPVFD